MLCPLVGGEIATDLRRHPRDERSGGDDRALQHDRSPGDQTAFADDRAGEDDASHPDQAAVTDRAAVDDGVVTYRHVPANHHRSAWIDVHRHVVLDVAAGPERDGVAVATQHGVVPDARSVLQRDGAHDAGARGDERRLREIGRGILQGEDGGIRLRRSCLRPYAPRRRCALPTLERCLDASVYQGSRVSVNVTVR